jgi:hypothetical protein
MKRIFAGDIDVTFMMKQSGSLMYVPFPEPLDIEYVIAGGGGAGGYSANNQGGGGGAGRFHSGSAVIPFGNEIPITIGSGGVITNSTSKGGNGGQSTMILPIGTTPLSGTIKMPGGGGGGVGRSDIGAGDGANGGSGGGGGEEGFAGDNYGGNATTGFPTIYNGIGYNGVNGGEGGAGQGGGANTVWLDGQTYAQGGGVEGSSILTTYGSGGRGGYFISGYPEVLPTPGNSGVVKIRYSGTPKATGGTITQSGGYTYHTFTSNDSFLVVRSYNIVQ